MSFTGSLSASGSTASQSVTGMVAIAGSVTNSSLVSASDAAQLVFDPHSPAPGSTMAAAALAELDEAMAAGEEEDESNRGVSDALVEDLRTLKNQLPFESFLQPESGYQAPNVETEGRSGEGPAPPGLADHAGSVSPGVLVQYDNSMEAELERVLLDTATGRVPAQATEEQSRGGPVLPEPAFVDETRFHGMFSNISLGGLFSRTSRASTPARSGAASRASSEKERLKTKRRRHQKGQRYLYLREPKRRRRALRGNPWLGHRSKGTALSPPKPTLPAP